MGNTCRGSFRSKPLQGCNQPEDQLDSKHNSASNSSDSHSPTGNSQHIVDTQQNHKKDPNLPALTSPRKESVMNRGVNNQAYFVLGHKTANIRDLYTLGRKLGQGQFGTTFLCTELSTGIEYACKSISKRKLISKEDVEDVRREIQIMHHLAGHKNIVTIKGAYEDPLYVHIVMELCSGGELFDRIIQRGHYSERKAAELTKIVVGVVEACHSLGVMHRDLKPENFLLVNKDDDFSLKAIDFGLSVFFKPGQIFTDVVGSPYYVAPEVLLKLYGPEADVWTAGVILYILLSGVPPFWAENQQGIFDAVLKGHIDFNSDPWPLISESAKDLIRKMLCMRPSDRLTAHEVLCHPWICENGVAPDKSLDPAVLSRLKQFSAMNKLKKMALRIESENQCMRQTQLFIDQISQQQGQILALEEERKRRDKECGQLRALVLDLERKGIKKMVGDSQVPVAAVVVMACNRADYLERTIKSILKYQIPVASRYPLFISQDGSDPLVKKKALSYDQLTYMQHLDYEPVHTERPGELIAYYKIARHYKWAMDKLFYEHKFDKVIILEDDMEIAPDFFDYFEAGAALLDHDKSIMAISSWNDNGQKQFVHDPYTLYRSDFFPGLGWMLSRSVWDELSPKWPKAYWDDWLRLKENHIGRQFIRPEVCRTYNFGEQGSSMGQFFKQYLEPIRLNDVQVDWKSMDLSFLEEDKYVKYFAELLKNATPMHGADAALKAHNIEGDVRVFYRDQSDFEYIARRFGIFEEWKDGVPRTAYKGVVVFHYHPPGRVFLVGPDSLQQFGIR